LRESTPLLATSEPASDRRVPGRFALGYGWSRPEPGVAWVEGSFSDLSLKLDSSCKSYIVVLPVRPLQGLPRKVFAWSRGYLLGEYLVTAPMDIAIPVPSCLLTDGRLDLTLHNFDCVVPSTLGDSKEERLLSLGLQAVRVMGSTSLVELRGELTTLTIPAAQLIGKFQSLGDNCEFGIAQHRLGSSPIGPFRFATTSLAHLAFGLRTGFEGLSDIENMTLKLDRESKGRREYLLQHSIYGLSSHTNRYQGEGDVEALRKAVSQRLRFELRLLLEDLKSGNKIWVIKRNDPLMIEDVLPIVELLRNYGDNALLYAIEADENRRPGTAERTAPGLLRGYIDRFASYDDATAVSSQCWLGICRDAFSLWQMRQDSSR